MTFNMPLHFWTIRVTLVGQTNATYRLIDTAIELRSTMFLAGVRL